MSSIIDDGKGTYRWVYEFNLFSNPTILFTVFKVMIAGVAAVAVLLFIFLVPDLVQRHAGAEDVFAILRLAGLLALLFVALTCVGYVAYALMQGGVYCVVFTMDENGIVHRQLPKQYKKAQVVGALNIIAGIVAGNPTQAGVGLTSPRDSISSDFAAVRSIKGSRALRVIKLNEPVAKNQVYVDAQDYDFVFDYIRAHCPNARVK